MRGLDLVEWQTCSRGEPLPARQDAVRIDGHAIEARIDAEDPKARLAPSIGACAVRIPEPTRDVRIDTGFATGDVVSADYDAMLAKLIRRGERATPCHIAVGAERDRRAGVAQQPGPRLGRIGYASGVAHGGVDTGSIQRDREVLSAGAAGSARRTPGGSGAAVLAEEACAVTTAGASAPTVFVVALARSSAGRTTASNASWPSPPWCPNQVASAMARPAPVGDSIDHVAGEASPGGQARCHLRRCARAHGERASAIPSPCGAR